MPDYSKLIRPEISTLTKYVPGKPIEEVQREYGLTEVVKLASNENPLGPSPKARAAVAEMLDELHLYPDGSSLKLRSAIASKYGVDVAQVAVGSGLDEILRLIGQTFLNRGEEAVMADLTFSVYSHSVKLMGGQCVVVPLKDYTHDLSGMAKAITENTKLVFIANPNNPTGTIVTKQQLDDFMSKVPKDVIVVLDEAYCEYVEDPDYPNGLDYLRAGHTVLVLRTFSKIYGLAALRLGYVMGPRPLIEAIHLMRPVFNANALAQSACIAALQDDEHVRRTREVNRTGKEYLMRQFSNMGLTAVPSHTNFIYVDVGMDGRQIFVELQKRGIIVRPMGHPTFVRITIGTPEQNRKLVAALREVLGEVKLGD